MEDPTAVVRPRPHYQQHLQVRPHTSYGGSRLARESSGEAASSSDDELLAGETHFDARVGVLCRKKSSKGVQFEQEPAERTLQLQGDQLKLKKKEKVKAKIFVYYVWVRRNISDYVPKDSHRVKDESLAVLAGWCTELMIVTFATSGAKEAFLQEFQRVNQETLSSLYGNQKEVSEHCLVGLGACIANASGATLKAEEVVASQTISVQPYETANEVARKCRSAFKLDSGLKAVLWLEGFTSHCMVGCESIFAAILYLIHDKHKSNNNSINQRRGSVLSEASSNSPNESYSMDLDESLGSRETTVKLSLHLQETCQSGSCGARKKKPHQSQPRRSSEVPSRIRNWLASNNRKSQLVRQGSVEALTSSSTNVAGIAAEPHSPIIGRPLAELYPSGLVSRPVTCLLAQIYHRCCRTRGIFRQPGSVSEKNQLLLALSQYDLAKGDNMPQLNHFGEHCIADALKHYLRNLPGCLLQKNLANQWIRAVTERTDDAAVADIRSVIQQMQPQNAHLLHMLMITLRCVADSQEQNQMTPANIGASVSFSVLDFDRQDNCLEAMEQEAQRVNKLIEIMIANYARIWPNEVENIRVRNDFVSHIHLVDDMSSMESLAAENGCTSRQLDCVEPLSLSSISKDSGLQLSDQQLDDNRTSFSKSAKQPVRVVIDIPERSQPPPYEIALRRQGRSHQRAGQTPVVPVQMPQPILPSTPPRHRERPPVPARLHRRPASLGPSNRQPLPKDGIPLAVTLTGASLNTNEAAESKTRHPLSTDQKGQMQQQQQQQRQPPPVPPHSQAPPTSRPVRGGLVPAATAAALAAAAAYSAAQQQPRFRKRSSSETRLDLIGIQQPQQQVASPQPVVTLSQASDPTSTAAAARRRDFERLTRLHVSRDCLDSPRNSLVGSSQVGAPQFASRHAPIRGGNGGIGNSADFAVTSGHSSPRLQQHQARPRTRLPEALQRKLADQPESLV